MRRPQATATAAVAGALQLGAGAGADVAVTVTAADGDAPPGPGVALVEVTNQTLVAVLPLLPGALLLSAPDGCLLLAPTRPSRCLVCMSYHPAAWPSKHDPHVAKDEGVGGHACERLSAGMRAWHSLRVAAAGNGTAGVASAVFKAADYSPPLPSGTFTLRAVFDPPDGARQNCAQRLTQSLFTCSLKFWQGT